MTDFSIEVVEKPTQDINRQLLDLTAACPMDGPISIVIERNPDFFSLLERRGTYRVLIARYQKRIIGSFALVVKDTYIDQKPRRTGYLCDLKIHPDFRDKPIAFRLIKAMRHHMTLLSPDINLCVIARGNTKAERLLLGRLNIPGGLKAAEFQVLQLFSKKRQPAPLPNLYEFCLQHTSGSLKLLNDYYQKYQFSTIFNDKESISGDKAWVILKQNTVVAFLSVADMQRHKQNRVIKIPPYIKAILWLARRLWPKLNFPQEGESIAILNIQYLAFAKGNEGEAMKLVQQARHYAYQNGFAFLSYGMDSRNPLVNFFKRLPRITFHSLGYVFLSETQSWDERHPCHDNFYLV